MALPSSFLVALVALGCNSVCSLGCDLPQTHGLLNRRALTLLGQMRRLPASSCQKDRNDFAFPQDVFGGDQSHKAQALSVAHVTNQKIFHFFCTEASSSAAWNTTLLEEFCTGLDRQLTRLEACVVQEVGEGEAPLTNEDVHPEDSILRNYFQRLSLYLQEKKYSPCAWEIVRAEIMRSLYSSTALQKRLRSEK